MHIWYLDIPGFIKASNSSTSFFPSSQNTGIERMNSVMRLTLIISFFLCFYRIQWAVYVFLTFAIITIIFNEYHVYISRSRRENLRKQMNRHDIMVNPDNGLPCTKPITRNPYMNFLISDVSFKPAACPVRHVNDDVRRIESEYIHRDSDDIFGTRNSFRQFYTMPVTSVPNQQDIFANWLYKKNKTS